MNSKDNRDETSKADLARACLVTITNNIGSISQFVAKAGKEILSRVLRNDCFIVGPSVGCAFFSNHGIQAKKRSNSLPNVRDWSWRVYELVFSTLRKDREDSFCRKLFEKERTEYETTCLRRQLLVRRDAASLIPGAWRLFWGSWMPPRTAKTAFVIYSIMTYIPNQRRC